MTTGHRTPSPLVTPGELAGELARSTVIDLRWRLGSPASVESFRAGHLPGAAFSDLERDFSAPPKQDGSGGRHPLPAAPAFGEAMRRLGVSSSRPVVVYDDSAGTSAARGWWLLRYYGHPEVRVLDGGLRAWLEAGLPLERGESHPTPGDFVPRPGGMPVLEAPAVLAFAASHVLLDAREAARFRGEVEPVDKVAGHIPGAVSAPTAENLDGEGRMLPAASLRRRFAGLGIGDDVEVAAYCGSGVTAAHEVLALASAGIAASLYPGSWSDWVSDPGRPVARGEG